jgi:hypothetical protein
MTQSKLVLIVGLQPDLIDFSEPDYAAYPGMTASKVTAGLNADVESLNRMGYSATLCLTDLGETSEATVAAALATQPYDCVMIGAGVRTIGKNFPLFEKLVNVVHQNAPQAKICFNTGPTDSLAAVQRWI